MINYAIDDTCLSNVSFIRPIGKDILSDTYRELADWARSNQRLEQLNMLENNWDGEGAAAVEPLILYGVRHWLNGLQGQGMNAPSRIVSDPEGSIIVEWFDNDNYWEVTFSNPFQAEWMSRYGNEPAQHGTINLQQPKFDRCDVSSDIQERVIPLCEVDKTTWSCKEEYKYARAANL